MTAKEVPHMTVQALSDAHDVYKSTRADHSAMNRMGRSQELVRYYDFLSMLSFAAIATSAWQLTLFQATPALENGGLAGSTWSTIWAFFLFIPIYLSMAEMASIAPIAGAQYHWVSEFAPDGWQRLLSYVEGWVSTLAWQAGNASGMFLAGTLIQSIVLINNQDYPSPTWQGTLFVMAVIVMATLVNIYGSSIVPRIQTPFFALSVITYIALMVVIWVRAPTATSTQVWTEWKSLAGWSPVPLAVMIGQLSSMGNYTGVDTVAHMSEEVRDSPRKVPRIMLAVFGANSLQIVFTTITMSYHLPDVDASLQDSTTYPAIYIMKAAMPLPWVTTMLTLICFFLMLGNVSYLAATTRDMFAFARDHGLPFSGWISKVDKDRKIPVNSYILSGILCTLLSLIYIGSSTAFYAIISLGVIATLQCYMISIGCILWRRIYFPETIPERSFSLGRWGVFTNATAVVLCGWALFWSAWPTEYPVTAATFNWASPIFALTAICSIISYYYWGRKRYVGPVHLIEDRKLM